MPAPLPQRLKLLIVDDDVRWRRLLREIFDAKALIAECEDGADAILGYRSLQPDWVIMDIAMEPIDGLTAARKIKAEFPQARIVFLTQFGDKEFRDEAERLGAAGYVLKDDLDQIENIICGPSMALESDAESPNKPGAARDLSRDHPGLEPLQSSVQCATWQTFGPATE